jgi:hypothetical protein
MIGVCAGYFRRNFFLVETINPLESNNHARREAYIPHMGTKLQTSHKDDLTQSRNDAEGKQTQTENIRQSGGMIQLNLVEINLLRGGHACPCSTPGPTVITPC